MGRLTLKEHIYSVLLVSASEKFSASLRTLLPETDYNPVFTVGSIGEAQRAFTDRAYDLVIVNAPLSDDFGLKFAVDVSLGRSTVALLIVRSEIYNEIYSKVVDCGVMTIRKPAPAASLIQAFDWMRTIRERLRGLEKKAVSLEDKMAEIRIVNRAKWSLIEVCRMTEADAHRYIEKQAMDRCVTRREVAEGILRAYEK